VVTQLVAPRLGRRPPQEPTAQQGTTFVIVSHALAGIRTLCDRVVWLVSGKIMMQGEPDEVIATYEKS
jgi:ABC-type polysaccharide/polyol phosphate transport system ATPase subunit